VVTDDRPGRAVVAHLLRNARGAVGLLVTSVVARTIAIAAGAALLAFPAWTVGGLADGFAVVSPRRVAVIMLVLAVVKAAGRYVEQLTGHIAAFTLLARLRVRLFDRLVPLAPAVTEAQGSGRLLAAAVKDIDRIEVFYAHTLAPVVTAVLIPVAAVVVTGLVAGPELALVLAVGLLLGGLGLVMVGARGSRSSAARLVAARTRMTQEISDDIRGHSDIVTFGAERQRAERVDRLGVEVAGALRGSAMPLGLRAAIHGGWQVLTLVALAAIGLTQVAGGQASLGVVLLAMALVPGAAPALASVEAFGRSLPAALASARGLLELEETAPAVPEPARPEGLDDVAGHVTFDEVSFGYPGRDGAVLHGLDLDVPAGSIVAVVGATGSGKSTIARLLTRTWDPDTGTVRLDGVDVRSLGLADLRSAVTVVDQRAVLLSGTVRENLLLGHADASDDELERACMAACLLDDIRAMPDGFDTMLGEDGARLSGGQAQRLALARGYLRRSPVLVLDEITSHQDPLTQAEMLRRMRDGTTGTVVLIAHRGAVLEHVDRVHVVEEGRVVESGTPAELAAAGGAFARLMVDPATTG